MNWTLRKKLLWDLNQNIIMSIQENISENVVCEMSAILFRPLCVNSLGPSDAIWRQRSGSTLAQVMACCLTAQSHYLNQCWLIISKVEWHSSKGKFTRGTSAINHWNYLKNQVPAISFKFPRGQWVKRVNSVNIVCVDTTVKLRNEESCHCRKAKMV